MKTLLVRVMLISITTATGVSAQAIEPFSGLGSDRSALSPDQIAARTERLEASTTFSLLRHHAALRAPARIFEPAIWSVIERAARAHDLDPMLLAGIIFVESYGDPLAKSPTGPAGIAQLTKGSAKELGLAVNRKIQVGSRTVTKTRFVGKGKSRRKIVEAKQQPVYKTIDERYVPERAIMAMARRVSNRRGWLGGKVDFAVAEYHMGAGRMTKLLSAYLGRKVKISNVTSEMQQTSLSYPELFWTNTPYFRPAVYKMLDDLTEVDYSPTYYFRVRQSMRLLDIYRQSPDDYARLAAGFQGRPGQAVLPSWESSFVADTDPAVRPMRSFRELEQEMGARFVLLPDIASDFGVRGRAMKTEAMLAAERSTIGSALFVAHHLRRLQGDRYTGFEINSMVTHEAEEKENASLTAHRLGWAFDVPAASMPKHDLRDLRFVLTDLRQAGLLAYTEEGRKPTFHIVRHPDHADRFEQFYWDAMAGTLPAARPRVASVASTTVAPNDGLSRILTPDVGRRPRVLVALGGLVSRMFSFVTGRL
jgi:hypothetical protein